MSFNFVSSSYQKTAKIEDVNPVEEARSSWNTVYLDRNGFACQITLRDEEEESLAQRVSAITTRMHPTATSRSHRPSRARTRRTWCWQGCET